MKIKKDKVALTSLKGVNYLCPNDIFDLAEICDRLLNAKSKHLTMLTINGLINKYSMINPSISSYELTDFLRNKGFELNQTIVNDINENKVIEEKRKNG